MNYRIVLTAAATLALAACGSSEDASTEAEADTVEISADEALVGVEETPVADANADVVATDTATVDESAVEQEQIQDAGDSAAETAEAAMDAMNEDTAN